MMEKELFNKIITEQKSISQSFSNTKSDPNKENIFDQDNMKKGKQTYSQLYSSSKRDEDIIKGTKRDKNYVEIINASVKRVPLQDINNIPSQNSHPNVDIRYETFKTDKKHLHKEKQKALHNLEPAEISSNEKSSSHGAECSELVPISKDSLPLSYKRLNIEPCIKQHVSRDSLPLSLKRFKNVEFPPEELSFKDPKDTFSLSHKQLHIVKSSEGEVNTIPENKFVTWERKFEPLLIDDSFSFSNVEDDSLFFDDSYNFSDEGQRPEHKEESKQKSSKELECMVLEIPKCEEIESTPANAHGLPEFRAIKLIRKNFLSQPFNEDNAYSALPETSNAAVKINNLHYNTLITNFKNKQFGSQNTLFINRNVPSPLIYIDKQQKADSFTTSFYKVPGAVYLDNQENFVFHQVLYSSTYLKSIVKYLLLKETKYQLSCDFLKKSLITDLNRSIVVNWLIKLQTYMRVQHVLVYTAVSMMDHVIDSMEIELNKLQLVALASFWLSIKYHSVDQKEVKWMIKQTGGAYTTDELIDMEQKVFQANKLDVYAVDPSSLIHYYVLKLELPNASIIAQCAHYLLDCALLSSRFVRILPSVMASAAVYTSLHLMKQYTDKLWMNLSFYCGYYPPDELRTIKKYLIEVLKEVNNPSFPCREPYYKYCSSRYCGVSNIILDVLFDLDL